VRWNEITVRIEVVWHPHETDHSWLHDGILRLRWQRALVCSHLLKSGASLVTLAATAAVVQGGIILLYELGYL
jgi:hypothetical protein